RGAGDTRRRRGKRCQIQPGRPAMPHLCFGRLFARRPAPARGICALWRRNPRGYVHRPGCGAIDNDYRRLILSVLGAASSPWRSTLATSYWLFILIVICLDAIKAGKDHLCNIRGSAVAGNYVADTAIYFPRLFPGPGKGREHRIFFPAFLGAYLVSAG